MSFLLTSVINKKVFFLYYLYGINALGVLVNQLLIDCPTFTNLNTIFLMHYLYNRSLYSSCLLQTTVLNKLKLKLWSTNFPSGTQWLSIVEFSLFLLHLVFLSLSDS